MVGNLLTVNQNCSMVVYYRFITCTTCALELLHRHTNVPSHFIHRSIDAVQYNYVCINGEVYVKSCLLLYNISLQMINVITKQFSLPNRIVSFHMVNYYFKPILSKAIMYMGKNQDILVARGKALYGTKTYTSQQITYTLLQKPSKSNLRNHKIRSHF